MNKVNWFKIMGSSILVSIACLDPGNLLGDINVAQEMSYKGIWVITMAHILLYFFQELAFVVSCKSGNDLGQLIRLNYQSKTKYFIWLSSELAIISADIQEVLGAVIAFNLLTGISNLVGIPIIIVIVMLILFLQEFGQKAFEFSFLIMVAVMGISFIVNFILSKPDWEPFFGGFIPSVPRSWEFTAVIGSIIMPQNIFLQSSLVQTRMHLKHPTKTFIKIFKIETMFILFVSCLINIALTSTFADPKYADEKIDLEDVHTELAKYLPACSFYFWAFGLLASGISSTGSGALTGQYLMDGIFNLRISRIKRVLITRLITLVPCYLIVVFLDVNKIMSLLNIIQFVQLPFVIVPLLKFSCSEKIMVGKTYKRGKIIFLIICSVVLQLINIYSIGAVISDFNLYFKLLVILLIILQFVFITYLAYTKIEESSDNWTKEQGQLPDTVSSSKEALMDN